ncbi:dockerin type I domain-containing protein [Mariniblastus sp.]|nr:dockerin type I domain-containing protein [Mariniblastus sp.]
MNSKNSKTRFKSTSFGYQSLEDRELTAVGSWPDTISYLIGCRRFIKQQFAVLLGITAIFLLPAFAVGQSVLGDVDQNGDVDFLDIAPFIALLQSSTFQLEADIDGDGEVNFLDIQPFINILAAPPSKFFQSNFTADYPVNGCEFGTDNSLCNGDVFIRFGDPVTTMEVGIFPAIDPNNRILRTTYAQNEDGRIYTNDGSLPDDKKLYGAFEFYLDGNFWDASNNTAVFAQAYKMPRMRTNGVTPGPPSPTNPAGPRQFDLIMQNANGNANIDIQFQNVFGNVTDPANSNSPNITVPAQSLVEQWYRVTYGIELNTAAGNGFMFLTLEPINADGSSAGTRLTDEFTGNISDPADTFNLTNGFNHFMANWSTGVGLPPNPAGQSIYWRNLCLDDEPIAP